ncbi:MAG: transposase [Candidatus Acidiferrales bacterium]
MPNRLAGRYPGRLYASALLKENYSGRVHAKRPGNFWSLVKRGLKGTYISVEPFHLFRYLDEQAFRYNNRKMNDRDRSNIVVREIVGKRLTWNQLTGKTEEDLGH